MKRTLIVILVFSAIGCTILFFFFTSESLPYCICGVVMTLALVHVSRLLWKRVVKIWQRVLLSMLSSWCIMLSLVIFGMIITDDPFAAGRIAEKGWVIYFLSDIIIRGLFFGIVFGTLVYSFLWIPMGVLWYFLLRWATREDGEMLL